jgi:CheY-like chemotaxis protein
MSPDQVILVVDDEDDLREIIADQFRFAGAKVLEAKNGKEAFLLIQSQKVDAVISDIRMPGGGGVELLDAIKQVDAHKPVVLLVTGHSDLTVEDALHKGAEAFFSKPFDLEALEKTVESFLVSLRGRVSCIPKSEIATEKMKFKFQFESFKKAREDKEIIFGRKGMCLALQSEFPRKTKELDFVLFFEKGEVRELSGKGVCRWVREPSVDSRACWIGVEITGLDESSLKVLKPIFQESSLIPFIPKE